MKTGWSTKIKRSLLGLVIALLVALFGFVDKSPRVMGAGMSAAVLVGYLVLTRLDRERLEARAREQAERRPPGDPGLPE